MAASSSMGSMMPWGKWGADPTMSTVSLFTFLRTAARLTLYDGSSTDTLTSFMPSTSQALSKAGCAVRGTTTWGEGRDERFSGEGGRRERWVCARVLRGW